MNRQLHFEIHQPCSNRKGEQCVGPVPQEPLSDHLIFSLGNLLRLNYYAIRAEIQDDLVIILRVRIHAARTVRDVVQ